MVGLFFFVLLFSSGELTTSSNFNFDDKLPLLAATHSYTLPFSPHCSLPYFRQVEKTINTENSTGRYPKAEQESK